MRYMRTRKPLAIFVTAVLDDGAAWGAFEIPSLTDAALRTGFRLRRGLEVADVGRRLGMSDSRVEQCEIQPETFVLVMSGRRGGGSSPAPDIEVAPPLLALRLVELGNDEAHARIGTFVMIRRILSDQQRDAVAQRERARNAVSEWDAH